MPGLPTLPLRRPLLGLVAAFTLALSAAPAFAQAAGCQDIGKTLGERREIIEKLAALGKKKQMDPKTACSMFGSLVSNGTTAVKWLDANKDWCQVPEHIVANIKADHARATEMRGKACKAAAQQAQMEKRAREGGGSSGLLGGDGLTGSFKLPQGAM
jgi:hypothetical protein